MSVYEEQLIWVGGTSGLLVKVLACNRKVACSSPTSTGFFRLWGYPEIWGGVYHRFLQRGCKAIGPGELVNISNLRYSSFLIKPHLIKKKKQTLFLMLYLKGSHFDYFTAVLVLINGISIIWIKHLKQSCSDY